ncbi:hypothetical protein Pla123a_40400 [Posidoniimonas polymericola]|uniref:PEP-CTERM protein-sorting domain-containing protein n=1 Tax=Posidoniimonas polymericola TaxID=2528002 RepID=A0A5C5YE52_9BACT|nr:hypothetical protein [Posidoniimonas polymericola]TWT72741.1 hypothetical protein Pla123a_40400 [Posidoniimonas polymericola]
MYDAAFPNSTRLFNALKSATLCLVALATFSDRAPAVLLYETSILGPTGITAQQFLNQEVPGTSISSDVFQAARFYLPQASRVAAIGGHVIGLGANGPANGPRVTIFGAIVALDDETDFPDSFDLSTPDVKGVTLIDLPENSDVAFGSLDVPLQQGWYAMVFGTGLFGSDKSLGIGGAARNNLDHAHANYIFRSGNVPGTGWSNQYTTFRNHYFAVQGDIIPEPGACALLSCLLAVLVIRVRR